MSLNISSDNSNATPLQNMPRSNGAAGARASRRAGSEHMPNAVDAVPKPQSPGEQADRPPLRAHPAASTDDSLRRLPESGEAGKRLRAKKSAADDRDRDADLPAGAMLQKARTPYDPPPVRQRDLDTVV